MCEEQPVPILGVTADAASGLVYTAVGTRAGRIALAAVTAAGGVAWLAVTPVTLPMLIPVALGLVAAAAVVAAVVAGRRARGAEVVAAAAIRRAALIEERFIAAALPAAESAVTAVAGAGVRAIEAPQVVAHPGWPSWTAASKGRS